MKKKTKIIALVIAFILIGIVLLFANSFVGNPISKMLAKNTAQKHLNEHYQNTDYVITEVNYNFKTGGYYARISSPSSLDTHFSLSTTITGEFDWDSYESRVLSGQNTFERVDSEYRKIVEEVFDAEDFPYESNISFGDIRGKYTSEVDNTINKNFGIEQEALILDKIYDIRELGKEHGSIVFYAQDNDVSIGRATEILLDIKKILDEEDVPFYAISFVLQKPRTEDDTPNPDSTQINLTDFLYSDIYEDGLMERVEKAHDETTAYYREQDAKK